MDVRIAVDDTV